MQRILLVLVIISIWSLCNAQSNLSKTYYDQAMIAKNNNDPGNFSRNLKKLELVIADSKNPGDMDDSSLYYYGSCLYYAKSILDLNTEAYAKAIPFIEKCALTGNPDCNFFLGYYHNNGLGGFEKDYEKAIHYYTIAMNGGLRKKMALNNLGSCYENLKQYDIALKYFKLSLELKNGLAASNIGWFHYYGYGVNQNYKKAFDFFKKGEELKDENLRYALGLGYCYYNGYGTHVDYDKAVYYFRKSASKKITNAFGAIGNCYRFGNGVGKNIDSAIFYLKMAALANSGFYANSVAYFYATESNYKNFDSVAKYANIAIDKGEDWGYANLAWAYNEAEVSSYITLKVIGKALATNNEKIIPNITTQYARLVFRERIASKYDEVLLLLEKYKGAKNEASRILDFLGLFYWYGLGVKRDYSKATSYFKEAIALGNKNAQNNLNAMQQNLRNGYK